MTKRALHTLEAKFPNDIMVTIHGCVEERTMPTTNTIPTAMLYDVDVYHVRVTNVDWFRSSEFYNKVVVAHRGTLTTAPLDEYARHIRPQVERLYVKLSAELGDPNSVLVHDELDKLLRDTFLETYPDGFEVEDLNLSVEQRFAAMRLGP